MRPTDSGRWELSSPHLGAADSSGHTAKSHAAEVSTTQSALIHPKDTRGSLRPIGVGHRLALLLPGSPETQETASHTRRQHRLSNTLVLGFFSCYSGTRGSHMQVPGPGAESVL